MHALLHFKLLYLHEYTLEYINTLDEQSYTSIMVVCVGNEYKYL